MSLKNLVEVCENEARNTPTCNPRRATAPRTRTVGEDWVWRLHNNKHEIREVISQRVNLKKTWPRSRVMTSRAATLKMTSFLGSVSSEKHGAARRGGGSVTRLRNHCCASSLVVWECLNHILNTNLKLAFLPRRLTDVKRYILRTFLRIHFWEWGLVLKCTNADNTNAEAIGLYLFKIVNSYVTVFPQLVVLPSYDSLNIILSWQLKSRWKKEIVGWSTLLKTTLRVWVWNLQRRLYFHKHIMLALTFYAILLEEEGNWVLNGTLQPCGVRYLWIVLTMLSLPRVVPLDLHFKLLLEFFGRNIKHRVLINLKSWIFLSWTRSLRFLKKKVLVNTGCPKSTGTARYRVFI